MAEQMAFVSAPAASPTINLNLSQPGLLKVKRDSFSFGAPQFEGDPYTDTGGYGERTVELTLQATGTYDEVATVFQDVSQQLVNGAPGMGGRNWLMFRWSPADPLMFLWTLPSSLEALDFQNAGAGVWELPLSIVCDADIIGAPEDIASFTITNDPTSGTNRMMLGPASEPKLAAIKGDKPTPLLLAMTGTGGSTTTDPFYVSSYAVRGFTHSFLARSLTELTSGTDVGATVSGAGANYIEGNYKSCSFATTTLQQRLSGTFSTALTPMPGLYRVLIRVVIPLTAGTNEANYSFRITLSGNTLLTPTVTKFMHTSAGGDLAYTIDLGVVQLHNTADYGAIGLGPPASTVEAPNVSLQASASLLAGAIPAVRFDELFLLPVTTTYGSAQTAIVVSPNGASTTYPLIHDGVNDSLRYVYDASGTAPLSGVPERGTLDVATFVGGLPTVVPGANNYLQFLYGTILSTAATNTYVARYWPRYVHPRPSAT